MTRMLTALCMMMLMMPVGAHAAEGPDFVGDKQAMVEMFGATIRGQITHLKLSDGSFVPAETPAELAVPIIPYDDAKRVVNRGFASAMAEHCGLDWQALSFSPLMTQERAKGTWSSKQIAYIGALHGITQGTVMRNLEKGGPCTPDAREKSAAILTMIAH